ncbi:uncharacterized protein OCT59_017113 [Rhizophagus irregularis]|uniref:uncharacterized protein n=1 Tax=Rhizophagus irregularis TaxID=588596 RepID=UPI003325F41E|nr:hypothetical protein OCT59_017113 [Rhizophagus irregularis]
MKQHQQRSQLQKQQQRIFHPPFQEQYVFQQQYDPQILHLSSTLFELDENYDETYLFRDEDDEISQTCISKQSHAKKKDDDDKDQDPGEKSGWKNSEIEILLDYLQENFTSWSKGNKTKFYNDMAKNILPYKEESFNYLFKINLHA